MLNPGHLMLRNLKFAAPVLLIMTFCSLQTAMSQVKPKTLRQVLSDQKVPIDADKLSNIEEPLASEVALNDPSQSVVAYTLASQQNEPTPPIYVDRYDRTKNEWFTTALGDGKAGHPAMDLACTGSLESIEADGAWLVIGTNLNPSAGCTLLFSGDLKLQATLFGWLVGKLNDDELLYEKNEVHFAPVHPTEIALFNVQSKQDIPVFPRKPYQSIWTARIERLKEFYRTRQSWCQANNDPCDPEQFDSALVGDVATNNQEKALAFVISFEQIQVFDGDQKPSGPKQVVYVYRNVDDDSKREYREMLMSDVKARFGNVSLSVLLAPERLAKIFSEAAKWNIQRGLKATAPRNRCRSFETLARGRRKGRIFDSITAGG